MSAGLLGRVRAALEWALLCARRVRARRVAGGVWNVRVALGDTGRTLEVDVTRSLEVYAEVHGVPDCSWWRLYYGGPLWGEVRDSWANLGFRLQQASFAGGVPMPLPLALLVLCRPGEDEPEWLFRFAARVYRGAERNSELRETALPGGWHLARTGPWWNLGLELRSPERTAQLFPALGRVRAWRSGVGAPGMVGGLALGFEDSWGGLRSRLAFTPWALARVLLGRP